MDDFTLANNDFKRMVKRDPAIARARAQQANTMRGDRKRYGTQIARVIWHAYRDAVERTAKDVSDQLYASDVGSSDGLAACWPDAAPR